jgi:hypothetical protein
MTGAGLVAAHSNCSVYEEATNAYKLGYSYVVILADFSTDRREYSQDTLRPEEEEEEDVEEALLRPLREEVRKLNLFVAIVSQEDYDRAIFLSSRYQNSISQPLRSEGRCEGGSERE